jgi:hypothetical protein
MNSLEKDNSAEFEALEPKNEAAQKRQRRMEDTCFRTENKT